MSTYGPTTARRSLSVAILLVGHPSFARLTSFFLWWDFFVDLSVSRVLQNCAILDVNICCYLFDFHPSIFIILHPNMGRAYVMAKQQLLNSAFGAFLPLAPPYWRICKSLSSSLQNICPSARLRPKMFTRWRRGNSSLFQVLQISFAFNYQFLRYIFQNFCFSPLIAQLNCSWKLPFSHHGHWDFERDFVTCTCNNCLTGSLGLCQHGFAPTYLQSTLKFKEIVPKITGARIVASIKGKLDRLSSHKDVLPFYFCLGWVERRQCPAVLLMTHLAHKSKNNDTVKCHVLSPYDAKVNDFHSTSVFKPNQLCPKLPNNCHCEFLHASIVGIGFIYWKLQLKGDTTPHTKVVSPKQRWNLLHLMELSIICHPPSPTLTCLIATVKNVFM